jgi:hypothetical protein
MKKRKAKIIKDPKLRGEWAESVFVARASELGLAVSRPWGDSKSFDFVVGRPGRFVSVQVKSTVFESGGGYSCSVKKNNQLYARGSFDFVAAYVIPEDVWYIVPAEKIRNKGSMMLASNAPQALYEPYREAWHLLREAAAVGEEAESDAEAAAVEEAPAVESAAGPPGNALERMQAAMNFFKNQLERGGVCPPKESEE